MPEQHLLLYLNKKFATNLIGAFLFIEIRDNS